MSKFDKTKWKDFNTTQSNFFHCYHDRSDNFIIFSKTRALQDIAGNGYFFKFESEITTEDKELIGNYCFFSFLYLLLSH